MKKTSLSFAIASALLVLQAGAARASTPITGEVGPIVIQGDAHVPAGQTCTLFGTVVTGDVTVLAGATLACEREVIPGAEGDMPGLGGGASIGGDVTVLAGATFTARAAAVSGDVRSRGGERVFLEADFDFLTGDTIPTVVGGDVDARDTVVLGVYFSEVEGDIRARDGRPSTFSFEIDLNAAVVGGDVTVDGYDATNLGVFSSEVAGDLRFVNNIGSLSVAGNVVDGDLTLSGNLGEFLFPLAFNQVGGDLRYVNNTMTVSADGIFDNVVDGDLVVRNNTPQPAVFNNTVGGRTIVR